MTRPISHHRFRQLCSRAVVPMLLSVSALVVAAPPTGSQRPPEAPAGNRAGQSAQVVRIAYIGALSGPFSQIAPRWLEDLKHVVTLANAEQWAGAGVTFELVALDGQRDPRESLARLREVLDQGIRYVIQGGSDAVSLALAAALERYNRGHPGEEALLLNVGSPEPALTGRLCSRWHFRVDASLEQRMEAVGAWLHKEKSVRRAYLFNPLHLSGQTLADRMQQTLERRRPDLKIVGQDLHPVGTVEDYTPYAERIHKSRADLVITSDRGIDLVRLVEAVAAQGGKTRVIALGVAGQSFVDQMGRAAVQRLYRVDVWAPEGGKDGGSPEAQAASARFLERHRASRATQPFEAAQMYSAIRLLAAGIDRAGSARADAVSAAMGQSTITALNGEVAMRPLDHQLQQPLVILSWQDRSGGKKGKQKTADATGGEQTRYWRTERWFPAYVGSVPTTCQLTDIRALPQGGKAPTLAEPARP